MKLKVRYLALLSLLLLSSCGRGVSKEVEDFLSTMNFIKTFESTKGGSLSFVYEHYMYGDLVGQKVTNFNFNKSSKNEYSYKVDNKYKLGEIKDDVVSSIFKLDFNSQTNEYSYIKKINDEEEIKETITLENATEKYTRIFLEYNAPFRSGGIFYGDYFRYNAAKYGLNFKVIEDELTYICEDENYIQGALMEQDLRINKLGLITKCYQKLTIKQNGEYSTLDIKANYL